MRIFFIVAFLVFSLDTLSGQNAAFKKSKPPVEFNSPQSWPSFRREAISNDGRYVFFYLLNRPIGSSKLIIRSTVNDWEKVLEHISSPVFTRDSKYFVYKTGTDSLCFFNLRGMSFSYIPNVGDFYFSNDSLGEWIAYRLALAPKELVLRKIETGEERRNDSIGISQFCEKGKKILLGISNNGKQKLQFVNLETDTKKNIWSGTDPGEKVSDFTFDEKGNQIAFIVERKKDKQPAYELWCYTDDSAESTMLVDNETGGIEPGLTLAAGAPEFSKDGKHIYFNLQETDTLKPKPGAAQVDIWSYRDKQLQSIQLAELKNADNTITGVVALQDKKLIRIDHTDEKIAGKTSDFVLVSHSPGNQELHESNWNQSDELSYWLVSVKDESRKLLRDHVRNPDGGLAMSPEGKWILYYDFDKKNFFSYEIATGRTRNITAGATTNWLDDENDRPELKLTWVPWRRDWLKNDEAVLMYDNYDIWQIDPTGIKQPVNLTNGYGQKHHIKFELLYEGEALRKFSIENKSNLVLKAFDKINKDRGFYNITLATPANPEKLSMGPYTYGGVWNNFSLLKAEYADVYLATRMNAIEYYNLFFTSDLKTFKPLTDLEPQKVYNWLTAELVHWKTFDSSSLTGILYKPEDFDPAKKYPVIFNYYEQRSNELNTFPSIKQFDADISIGWFVSHDYLVFVPDIHYKMGEPGQSAYNAIVSAAGYLSKKSWVDAKRMGIQGFSFGGYETDYVVTHSHLFAAACAGSGATDFISMMGFDGRGTYPNTFYFEKAQGRLGETIWKAKDQYIRNSPIFNADKVTTPLLMMNNKKDFAVPFSQGVEFFTALRRMGKKVWMLQYDNSGHSTSDPVDYSTRVIQFFDHYLKGAPAPRWMTEGVPAKMKTIEDGLELEPAGVEPGPGLNKK